MKWTARICIVVLIAIILIISIVFSFTSIYNSLARKRYDDIHTDVINAISSTLKSKLEDTNRGIIDYEKALDEVNLLDSVFVDIIILTMSGEVIVSTSEVYEQAYIYSLSSDIQKEFTKEKGSIVMCKDYGDDIYLTFNSFSPWDKERIVGILPKDIYNYSLTENTIYNLLEIFLITITLASAFIISLFVVKHRDDTLYLVKPTNNFILKITEHGKILSSDKQFEEKFCVKTLENTLVKNNNAFALQLKSGQPIISSLTDKEGNNEKVIFNATSSLGCYKLLGAVATDYVNNYLDFQQASMVDEVTNFYNYNQLELKWNELKIVEKDITMVFFTIRNYDYYKSIWGDSFTKSMVSKYAYLLKEVLENYGDFFAIDDCLDVLIINKEQKNEFMDKIDKIFDKLYRPIKVFKQNLLLDIRGGIVNLDMDNEKINLESALINGKTALGYAVNNTERKYYHLTASFVGTNNLDIRTKEGILSLINNGKIDVYYQPQLDVNSGKIVGVEALMRFANEEDRNIRIEDFVHSAETTGCMIELGEYIYTRALEGAIHLRKLGVSVSINISPIQLIEIGFVEKFLSCCKAKGFKEKEIHIEIVESVLIHSMKEVALKIETLKKHGIEVEIDDFGTGYSSLSYIREMNIDTIKLDRLFVKNIENSERDKVLVKNILNLCNELGLKSVIEGVSTKKQVEILKDMGCQLIQGFWLSKAQPLEKIIAFIKEINKEW